MTLKRRAEISADIFARLLRYFFLSCKNLTINLNIKLDYSTSTNQTILSDKMLIKELQRKVKQLNNENSNLLMQVTELIMKNYDLAQNLEMKIEWLWESLRQYRVGKIGSAK